MISKCFNLTKLASGGTDDFSEGAVGAFGYGFVFRDIPSNKFTLIKSNLQNVSKLCNIRTISKFIESAERSGGSNLHSLFEREDYEDIRIAGKIKTLVPSIKYGGYELLFEVLLFVLTPQEQFFPLIFYYGASGLALGGFDVKWDNTFNFNPFNYGPKEKELLIKSFLVALQKVPPSDFYGIYKCDQGNFLMALRDGRHRSIDLGEDACDSQYVSYFYDKWV